MYISKTNVTRVRGEGKGYAGWDLGSGVHLGSKSVWRVFRNELAGKLTLNVSFAFVVL